MSDFWSGSPSSTFDEWAVRRIAYLGTLEAGAHIHIIGICGTGTGALLQLLVAKGYRVTGSDRAFYPPMGDIVKEYAAELYEGFSEDSLSSRPDCVVIGNTAGAQNPEVLHVLQEKIPFCSLDEALNAFLIGSREYCPTSIVIAGTHGKTTTTALTTWLFESAGRNPAYFVGGVLQNFSETIRGQSEKTPVEQRVVVLEGDEYNSAFCARYSKFHAYRADILVITSLEFDHGDIFSSIEDIEEEFSGLVAAMPKQGKVFVSASYPRLIALANTWREKKYCSANIFVFGDSENAEYRVLSRTQTTPEKQTLSLSIEGEEFSVETTLSGAHNAENVLAASIVGIQCGLTTEQIAEALPKFAGVARRQQLIFDSKGIKVVEDFAHHPTAVEKTLEGLAEAYRPKRLIVAFDPRSNTSRRHFFQKRYAEVFSAADIVYLKKSDDPGSFSLTGEVIALDAEQLVADINANETTAHLCSTAKEILEQMTSDAQQGDLLVLMSNGSFDGLPQQLPAALANLSS